MSKAKQAASRKAHVQAQRSKTGALKKGSAFTRSNASNKIDRPGANKGEHSHLRTKSTINRLNMYNTKGTLSSNTDKPVVRIQPDKRWFGNTRVITQEKMQQFREEMSAAVADPFQVVLRASKLPMSLLKDNTKEAKLNLLQVEKFSDTFGGKATRKRPKLQSVDMAGLVARAQENVTNYAGKAADGLANRETLVGIRDNAAGEVDKEFELAPEGAAVSAAVDAAEVERDAADLDGGAADLLRLEALEAERAAGEQEGSGVRYIEKAETSKHWREAIFDKGTSKRIYKELYKVIDSSDVILFVLDARDPNGTRCRHVEAKLKKDYPHKHVVLVLNKVDLVPTSVTKMWLSVLKKEYPTVAFHASITNSFGKAALIQVLRQFGTLLKDRKHVSIGLIGYPNVGKSSLINTLRKKNVCKAAPVPGETRVWQYVTLTRKLYLIDAPGIVPMVRSTFDNDTGKLLKGVVRVEKISNLTDYVDEVIARCERVYINRRYKLTGADAEWESSEDLLSTVALKFGKRLKGGDPDVDTAARSMLYDWQRGRIPYYVLPPHVADGGEFARRDQSAKKASAQKAKGAKEGEEEEKPLVETERIQQDDQDFRDLKVVHDFTL